MINFSHTNYVTFGLLSKSILWLWMCISSYVWNFSFIYKYRHNFYPKLFFYEHELHHVTVLLTHIDTHTDTNADVCFYIHILMKCSSNCKHSGNNNTWEMKTNSICILSIWRHWLLKARFNFTFSTIYLLVCLEMR